MRLGRGVVDVFVPRNKVGTCFIVKAPTIQFFLVETDNLVLIENQFFGGLFARSRWRCKRLEPQRVKCYMFGLWIVPDERAS
jgi:hypothetical protein